MSTITTVVFDLDDTLYDELDYCRSGFKAVTHFLDETMGRGRSTAVFEAICREFDAGNRTATFNVALNHLGIAHDPALIRSLVRIYRNHKPNLRLPPDSRRVLKTLAPHYRLALLTDGFLPAQKLKVRALNLERWFQAIVYTEQWGRAYWKPSPRGFERLMDLLACSAGEMVYVGDNPTKDFIAPNQLGMTSVQVRRAHGLYAQLPTSDRDAAQYVLDDLSALPELLPTMHPRTIPCPRL